MIVCSICKKFVKDVRCKINILEDVKDATGICKIHGRVKVDWNDYQEIVGSSAKRRG